MQMGTLSFTSLLRTSYGAASRTNLGKGHCLPHIYPPLSLNIPVSLKVFLVSGHGGTWCIFSTWNTWNDLSCQIACIIETCLEERKKEKYFPLLDSPVSQL